MRKVWVYIILGGMLLPACSGARSTVQAPQSVPSSARTDYWMYTGGGQPAAMEDVVAAMSAVDVVFIGEEHTDSVAHRLEALLLEETHRQYAGSRPVSLSLEMFSRDVQYIVDEYLQGLITEEHFMGSANPWDNYEEAYRPLVEYAREHGLPLLASNAPRRYVNLVARLGPTSLNILSLEAKATLPPLPYRGPSAAYQEKWNRLMTGEPHPQTPSDTSHHAAAGPGISNMLYAQVLWDAAMAYSIAEHLAGNPNVLVLHVTGSFHVEERTGTPEQLAGYRPGTRILTILIRPADDPAHFGAEELTGLGDFIVLTRAAASQD
jgi:uncharacterized iron-regulated protein